MNRWYTTQKKRSKYGNKKVEIDGVKFDSGIEAKRYQFLRQMEQVGLIQDLQRQVRYELIPKITHEEVVHLKTKDKTVTKTDQLAIHYTADFVYVKADTQKTVIEDVKGSKYAMSADAPLRFKLFFWRYGIKVRLVTKYNEEV